MVSSLMGEMMRDAGRGEEGENREAHACICRHLNGELSDGRDDEGCRERGRGGEQGSTCMYMQAPEW